MATLTFTVGTRPRSSGYRMAVNIPINNDNCVELEETFDVTATAMDSNVRFQIGGDSTVVSIPANDGKYLFVTTQTYTYVRSYISSVNLNQPIIIMLTTAHYAYLNCRDNHQL